jgi:hypothetical protein
MPATELTPKQARFVEEFMIDLNATQAAIRAGYSELTADVHGPRLLGNVGVAAAIAAMQAAIAPYPTSYSSLSCAGSSRRRNSKPRGAPLWHPRRYSRDQADDDLRRAETTGPIKRVWNKTDPAKFHHQLVLQLRII